MTEVVLVLVAVFHTFNLEYTKGVSAILIFIDKYAFGFNDQRKVPMTVQKLITNLNSLESEGDK